MVERLTRGNVGQMQLQVTFEDAEAYARPWTVTFEAELVPDTDLLESICMETDPDRFPLVGRTEAEKRVKVPPETLAKYVGTYAQVPPAPAVEYVVTLSDGELVLDVNGRGRLPMIPLSESVFVPPTGGAYRFVMGDDGVVSHMQIEAVSGPRRAVRRR